MNACSYFTPNHNTHDGNWLCSISSSCLCFACAVETLKSEQCLPLMKKRILQDILEIFLTSRRLVTHLCNQSNVLNHSINIVISQLPSGDSSLDHLIFNVLAALVSMGSSLEPLYIVLADITLKLQSEQDLAVKILGRVLRQRPSAVDILATKEPWIVEKIISAIHRVEVSSSTNYWFVLVKFYQSDAIPSLVSTNSTELLIESCINALIRSTTHEVQLNVLAALKLLVTRQEIVRIFIHFENGRSSSDQSIVDGLKKMIISSNEEIQIIALQCIHFICSACIMASENDLLLKFIKKGTCEFLFELLVSDNDRLRTAVLSCLSLFSKSAFFYSLGHFVYGLDPLISALKHSIEGKRKSSLLAALNTFQVCFEALCTAKVCTMLSNEQILQCLKLLIQSLKFNDVIIDTLVAEVADSLLHLKFVLQGNVLHHTVKYFTTMGSTLLKCVKKNQDHEGLNPLTRMLHSILKSFGKVAQTFKDNCVVYDTSLMVREKNISVDIVLSLFDIVDSFLLPGFLIFHDKVKNSNIIQAVLIILDALTNFEETIAVNFCKKLGNSCFIRILLDIRAHPSCLGLNQSEILKLSCSLLTKICCALEGEIDHELRDLLEKSLGNIVVTPKEWKLFFAGKGLRSYFSVHDYVINYCAPCMALLYYSALAGDELQVLDLTEFISSDDTIETLSSLSRKHLVFLWAKACREYLKESSIPNKRISSRLLSSGEVSETYTHSLAVLSWSFDPDVAYEIKLSFLKEYLCLSDKQFLDIASCKAKNSLLQFVIKDEQFCRMVFDITLLDDQYIFKSCQELLFWSFSDPTLKKNIVNELTSFAYQSLILESSNMPVSILSQVLQILLTCVLTLEADMMENDLKLFCHMLTMYTNQSSLDIRLKILNYLNVVTEKALTSQHSQTISIVLANSLFIKEVSCILVSQNFDVNMVKDEPLYEKVMASTVILCANLSWAISRANINCEPTVRFSIVKTQFLELLKCRDCKLLQISILFFWQKYLRCQREARNIFHLIDSHGNPSPLVKSDLMVLQIAVQRSLFSQSKNICRIAVSLYETLLNYWDGDQLLCRQPWNTMLLCFILESLSNSDIHLFSVQVLYVIFKFCLSKSLLERSIPLFSKTISMIEDAKELSLEVNATLVLCIDVVLQKYAAHIDAEHVDKFMPYLHAVHGCCEDDKPQLIYLSSQLYCLHGLIIPSVAHEPLPINAMLSTCKACIKTIENLKHVIDDTTNH